MTGLILQIVLVGLFSNVLCAQSDSAQEPASSLKSEVSALKERLREDSLNIYEEMYSHFADIQSSLLLLHLIDLIKEVKEMQGLARVQGEEIKDMESTMAEKFDSMESKLFEELKQLETKQESRSEKTESKLVTAIEEIKSMIVEDIKDVESNLIGSIEEVGSKVSKVDNKIEVTRSEVRLISQQKLTWQNSTYAEKLFSEYAVDGVYTASGDLWGLNPIQHIGGNSRNFMLIVDLGGFFKIHTVKVWNRVDCCQSQSLGVLIYADDELLGGINEEKLIFNFKANDGVYARKIYLKQSTPNWMNLREVQVFGTGPYDEDEIEN